ncbi:hypothetical protein HU200_035926 [Digitaria exilis]|uniref:Uncharacterized protein n=1 Tax=Digitaria exilis TaxID=1010633 RepID=A0A835BQM9_9POAL|nr:hypothetical protein HU200_035926 [Digitaria exilis]
MRAREINQLSICRDCGVRHPWHCIWLPGGHHGCPEDLAEALSHPDKKGAYKGKKIPSNISDMQEYVVEDLHGNYTPPKLDPEHEERLKMLKLL